MAQIENGRMTHEHDGPIGVFLIGMRFNRLHRPDQWVPVFAAMPRMLAELYRNKAAAARGEAEDLGFLGARTLMGGKGVTVVQYWRSVEDVYRYASAPDHEHRPPGPRSTPAPARPPVPSASGTRPTRSRPAPTRASTSACRSWALPRRRRRSPYPAGSGTPGYAA